LLAQQQPTTVTMTVKNKAVKGCGGLPPLFTNCREGVFSETRLPVSRIPGN
jgi:hypothetical protein